MGKELHSVKGDWASDGEFHCLSNALFRSGKQPWLLTNWWVLQHLQNKHEGLIPTLRFFWSCLRKVPEVMQTPSSVMLNGTMPIYTSWVGLEDPFLTNIKCKKGLSINKNSTWSNPCISELMRNFSTDYSRVKIPRGVATCTHQLCHQVR